MDWGKTIIPTNEYNCCDPLEDRLKEQAYATWQEAIKHERERIIGRIEEVAIAIPDVISGLKGIKINPYAWKMLKEEFRKIKES